MPEDSQSPNTGDFIRNELWAVLHRAAKESDITYYQCLGALEMVKQDLIDELTSIQKNKQQ